MTYARFIAWQGDLPKWDGAADTFRVSLDQALDDLLDECEQLGADEVLIETGWPPSTYTRSGRPPARGYPDHPGVRVAFAGVEGPLTFTSGHYGDWQANLRGIGLTLTALRAVNRYGAAGGKQYTGWLSIANTAPDPRDVLARHAFGDQPVGTIAGMTNEDLYKLALKRVHPDTRGGSVDLFRAVQEAKRSLEASGRWPA